MPGGLGAGGSWPACWFADKYFGVRRFSRGNDRLADSVLRKLIQSDWYSTLSVTMLLDGLSEIDLRRRLQQLGLIVNAMRLDYDLEKKQKTAVCDVKLKRREVFDLSANVVKELTLEPGIVQVKWG
jgi:hypothetical protein